MIRPMQNTVSREKMLRQPSGQAGDRQDAGESAMRPSTCTMPSSARTSCVGARIAGGVDARTTSVDMASATTSWITVPMTISMAPRM